MKTLREQWKSMTKLHNIAGFEAVNECMILYIEQMEEQQ